jgi:hypothetical protein
VIGSIGCENAFNGIRKNIYKNGELKKDIRKKSKFIRRRKRSKEEKDVDFFRKLN